MRTLTWSEDRSRYHRPIYRTCHGHCYWPMASGWLPAGPGIGCHWLSVTPTIRYVGRYNGNETMPRTILERAVPPDRGKLVTHICVHSLVSWLLSCLISAVPLGFLLTSCAGTDVPRTSRIPCPKSQLHFLSFKCIWNATQANITNDKFITSQWSFSRVQKRKRRVIVYGHSLWSAIGCPALFNTPCAGMTCHARREFLWPKIVIFSQF